MIAALCVLAACLLPAASTAPPVGPALGSADDSTPGPVLAVGGGGVPDAARARMLELAGGKGARVLVVPFASERPEAGAESEAAWREAGATAVEVLAREPAVARAQVAAAQLIWFGGGDQNRLMDVLRELDLVEAVRARHRAGAALGGTSAGAAVMSRHMITGEANLEVVHAGATQLAEGLGVWPGAIVDQHFLARRRMNRLISAVLDHPGEIGVGIDEGTAALFHRGTIEVIGESQVMVIDARAARGEGTTAGSLHAAQGLVVHLLRAGMAPWAPGTPAPAAPAAKTRRVTL